jgi:hypothetical protein
MKTPDANFFFQNKAPLNDDALFHHRKNCRIAFLSNGWHGIDLTANWYSIDLHPFVVQRFIDEGGVLARNGADLHPIARDPSFRHGEIFCVQRKMCCPNWHFSRHGKPPHEQKSGSLQSNFSGDGVTKNRPHTGRSDFKRVNRYWVAPEVSFSDDDSVDHDKAFQRIRTLTLETDTVVEPAEKRRRLSYHQWRRGVRLGMNRD